jgi:hypothetical protein
MYIFDCITMYKNDFMKLIEVSEKAEKLDMEPLRAWLPSQKASSIKGWLCPTRLSCPPLHVKLF